MREATEGRADTAATAQRSGFGKVIAAGLIGSILEWYDYLLYGTAAAVVFSPVFFPEVSPTAASIGAFGSFAIGFFVRPVGGLVIGHFGDRLGRKNVLVATLVMMGLGTTLIGLLPTYAAIGVAAPVLLVVLRVVQGLGAGAEYAGSVLLIAEHGGTRRRGLFTSLPGVGTAIGGLLASGAFALTSRVTSDTAFLAWGWRVPFLLSFVVVVAGLWIRFRILETPVFTATEQAGTKPKVPLLTLIRQQPRELFVSFMSGAAVNLGAYLAFVYGIAYLTTNVGMAAGVATLAVAVTSAVRVVTIPAFGGLSDLVGRKPVFVGGALALAVVAFPMFWLLDSGVAVLAVLGLVLALPVATDAMFGVQGALYSELFGTDVRFTGLALARELSGAVFGGTAPLLASAMVAGAGGATWPVSVFVIAVALLSTCAILLVPETRERLLARTAEQR